MPARCSLPSSQASFWPRPWSAAPCCRCGCSWPRASGIGPFSGQCGHFMHDAPDPNPCAPNHRDFEAWRHWKMLCTHPADQPWMVGGRYTPLSTCSTWCGSTRREARGRGGRGGPGGPHAAKKKAWRRGSAMAVGEFRHSALARGSGQSAVSPASRLVHRGHPAWHACKTCITPRVVGRGPRRLVMQLAGPTGRAQCAPPRRPLT